MFRWINWYPPFLGAGIRVRRVNGDGDTIEVEMKLRFWNKNYVGTHYGGSLYSMCDPFFALILMQKLGKEYVVWDKAAQIRFIKPGTGRVRSRFHIPPAKVLDIRNELETLGKSEYIFTASVVDEQHNVIAEVEKLIYVRKKNN